MRTLLVSALALGAMTSATLAAEPAKQTPAKAGPVVLTDAQMDRVAAGQIDICVVCAQIAAQVGAAVVVGSGNATVDQDIDQEIN